MGRFRLLKDVFFEIKQGDLAEICYAVCLGIISYNGAGKLILLKVPKTNGNRNLP
jgi:ABC-type polysaccharide/polyol phosphate transport system ATPase subunit